MSSPIASARRGRTTSSDAPSPQHDEAREIELGIGPHGLANKFRCLFLAGGEVDRADAGRSIVRIKPEVPDLRGIHPGKDAWGVAGDNGLRLRRLRQVLYLPDDAGEIEGGEIVLGLFDRDERERGNGTPPAWKPAPAGSATIPA